MEITIQSTDKIVELNGVPARVWEGVTKFGVPVICFVTRISPQTTVPGELRLLKSREWLKANGFTLLDGGTP